ncbi:hypothetical protein P3T22_006432 [Paraburkholderia sp. GAS348]
MVNASGHLPSPTTRTNNGYFGLCRVALPLLFRFLYRARRIEAAHRAVDCQRFGAVLAVEVRILDEQRYVLANPFAGIKVRGNPRIAMLDTSRVLAKASGYSCVPSRTDLSTRMAGLIQPRGDCGALQVSQQDDGAAQRHGGQQARSDKGRSRRRIPDAVRQAKKNAEGTARNRREQDRLSGDSFRHA